MGVLFRIIQQMRTHNNYDLELVSNNTSNEYDLQPVFNCSGFLRIITSLQQVF